MPDEVAALVFAAVSGGGVVLDVAADVAFDEELAASSARFALFGGGLTIASVSGKVVFCPRRRCGEARTPCGDPAGL